MDGAALAAKRRHDEAISLAWHTAALSAAAQNGKLKRLPHYLGAGQPRKAQTPSEMLALLKGFERHGMKITRLN